MSATTPVLAIDEKIKTEYCIPIWLRDQQIAQAIPRVAGRIEPGVRRTEPIACVCYGPSLAQTVEQIRAFRYIMSCSGAHRFLVERGIVPTWHVEVDPRPHKTALIGPPCHETTYLIASTCHAAVFDHLADYDVKLWHVFDTDAEARRTLPPGEWAITGGCSVGLRTMTLAHFLGFTDLHVFGMDGSVSDGTHAAAHPNPPRGEVRVEYPTGSGVLFRTTPALLETARQTWHELDQMPDVTATFYGEGLVQAMAKGYHRTTPPKSIGIAVAKPRLLSPLYCDLNAQLHRENPAYGVGGDRHAPLVLKLATSIKTKNILDYGCGKGRLARAIPWAIAEYDPAIPGKDESPKPADLVVCTDVLEHVEPDYLDLVLGDLRRCIRQVGFFTISTGPAKKTLSDGRNTHLIQQGREWWQATLSRYFTIGTMLERGAELFVMVAPKPQEARR